MPDGAAAAGAGSAGVDVGWTTVGVGCRAIGISVASAARVEANSRAGSDVPHAASAKTAARARDTTKAVGCPPRIAGSACRIIAGLGGLVFGKTAAPGLMPSTANPLRPGP